MCRIIILQPQTRSEPMEKCCAGYELNESRDGCEPSCPQKCLHGKCISPGVCRCDQGYGGLDCNRSGYSKSVFK